MPLSRSLRPARAALRTLLLLPLLAALCGCGPLWPIAPPDEDVMVTEPPLATAPSPRETLPESSPSAAPQGSPSPAAAPAASPSTTAEAAPAPTAVVLQGEAGEVSLPLALPPGLYRARIQFTGAGQIALTARSADGADQPLLDAPGPYEGEALLNGIPSGSLDALAEEAVAKALADAKGQPLTAHDRLALVRSLEADGIFLVKGAVGRVARLLGVSQATLYRDLTAIRR